MTSRFLLTGFATELSLRPLERALRERGLPTALVDLATTPVDSDSLPPGEGPLVLITSQHSFMTGDVLDDYVGARTHYLSPQALRERIRADLMVYVPHDLAQPVLPPEIPLLRLFDLYAAPDHDAWWARAHVPTLVCGWVGTAGPEDPKLADAPLDAGVLFAATPRLLLQAGGGPFLRQAFGRTLATGVAVKLPLWPAFDAIRDDLARAGIPLVDPELATSAILSRTPLVVTNGPSSVLAEAAMAGHRPVCVLHPEHVDAFLGELGTVDVVACHDDDFESAAASAGRVRPAAAPFDVDALLAAIDSRLADR
jgi:hypothetical protein